MRILEVCPYDLERPGGVQRHVLDLSEALAEAGHEVVVVAPGTSSKSRLLRPRHRLVRVEGARVFSWHGTAFELTRASASELAELLALHKDAPFDVVHFHTLWTPLLPWQVFRLFASQPVRCIATFHDTPPSNWSGQLMRCVFRLLSRFFSFRLDAAIAVSDAPARHLWLSKRCPLHTLPPCIDLRALRELAPASRDGSSACILFLGRLEPRKGVLLLIQAFAQLRQRHQAARLVVCGEGEQAGRAQALAQSLGLGKAIFFTGRVDVVERNRLLAEADVFCAPSPYGESYGLVLAEAMAAGLPVVAAANLGYRSVLAGEGSVGLTQPGDVQSLTEKLAELIESRSLRNRLTRWGQAHAQDSDVRHRLNEFVEIFDPAHLQVDINSEGERNA